MRRRILESVAIAIIALSMFFCFFLLFTQGSVAAGAHRNGEVSGSVVVGTVSPDPTASVTPVPTEVNGTPCAADTCSALITANASEDTAHVAFWAAIIGDCATILVALFTLIFSSKSNKKAVRKEIQRVVEVVKKQEINRAIREYEENLRDTLTSELQTECKQFLGEGSPDVTKLYFPLRFPASSPTIGGYTDCGSRDPVTLIRHEQRYLERRLMDEMQEVEFLDLDKQLEKKKYILWGYPHGGKTVLLKNLALKTLERSNTVPGVPIFPLPIFVNLQEFAESDKLRDDQNISLYSLIDFVADGWERSFSFPKNETGKLARDFLVKEVKKGHVRFFLDGLTERKQSKDPNEARKRLRVIEALSYINSLEGSSMVIAVRPSYNQQERIEIQTKIKLRIEWTLLDYCPEDIVLFVKNWFAALPKNGSDKQRRDAEREASFLALLDRSPRLQALAAHPLLLMYMLKQYTKGVLPQDQKFYLSRHRVKLYEKAVDMLLQGAKDSPNEEQMQLLYAMSWYLHTKRQYMFKHEYKKEDFIKEVTSLPALSSYLLSKQQDIAKWINVLDELISESGLFRERRDNEFAFICLPLQEYLAASMYSHTLKEDRNKLGWEPQNCCMDAWWEEVTLLCIAMEKDTELVELLQSSQTTNDQYHTALLFKSRFVAASPNITHSSPLYENIGMGLLDALLEEKYLFAQERIYHALLEVDITAARKGLEQLQQIHNNGDLKSHKIKRAAETLPLLGIRDNRMALLSVLIGLDISDPVIANFVAMYSSEEVHTKASIVTSVFEQSKGMEERIYAAHFVGLLGEQHLARPLLERLSIEPDPLTSWSLAYVIGKLGNRTDDVVDWLFYILRDPDKRFSLLSRWSVANALAALATLGKRAIVKNLIDVFTHLYNKIFKSRDHRPDDELIIWQVIIVLHILGSFHSIKEFVEQMIAAGAGIDIVPENIIHEWIERAIPNPPSPQIFSSLLVDLTAKLQNPGDSIPLLDVLDQLASTDDLSKKVAELGETLAKSNIMYSNIFYKAGWMIKERARNEYRTTVPLDR